MKVINLKVEQFEGPLDLLLTLITKHKIDILDIPIAEVADQYITVLDEMRELNMEVTSDFLVMAAELMLIKSRLLLPRDDAAEDPRTPLVDALLELQRAKAAAQFLREQSAGHYDTFTKAPDEPAKEAYSRGHSIDLLLEAFERISDRLELRKNEVRPELFEKLGNERYYTVEEKTAELVNFLRNAGHIPFEALFTRVSSRGEAVAIFLAVLECVRDGVFDAEREGDEIMISFLKEPENSFEEVVNDEYE